MNNSIVEILIRPSRFIKILIYLVILLVLLDLTGLFFKYYLGYEYVYGFVQKFNLNLENNIPTYFSSLLLLIASCLLYVISIAIRKCDGTYGKHWFLLSIMFLCLSIDESSSIHELLIEPLRNMMNLPGFLYNSWIIVGFIVVIALAIIYLRFLMDLPKGIKNNFILAAGVYLGGALGIELLGGYYVSSYGSTNIVYALITAVEETFEMVGVIIFINALIHFLSLKKISLQVSIVK